MFGNRHVYAASHVPHDELELGDRAAAGIGLENFHALPRRRVWLGDIVRDRWRHGG